MSATARPAQRIEWIPIERITIVNPRVREKHGFRQIVDNIAQIGLKRPITVTRRAESDGPFYDLVCGQGRLEAYQALGQSEVPALVVSADADDCLIASLVENCARRHRNALDLLQDIGGMRGRGYSQTEIARKTGLSIDYVIGVSRLMENGEQRLLRAAESGTIPLSVAIDIAEADDHGVQRALQLAYDQGLLRGKKLIAAKRVVDERKRRGKGLGRPPPDKISPVTRLSTAALLRAYEDDAARKRDLIKRAHATRDRLLLITEALRRLTKDSAFVDILLAEGLDTMPESIAQRLVTEPRPT